MAPLAARAAEMPPPDREEKGVKSFQGRVGAVDASGRILTVEGTRMYVPDSTKLTRKGRPITIYDITVNDQVRGTTRKAIDGTLETVTVVVDAPPFLMGASSDAVIPVALHDGSCRLRWGPAPRVAASPGAELKHNDLARAETLAPGQLDPDVSCLR
jgi:hypothetical protein